MITIIDQTSEHLSTDEQAYMARIAASEGEFHGPEMIVWIAIFTSIIAALVTAAVWVHYVNN